jgi:uncharacterized protein DUF222/HNH endonuclease
MSTLRSALDELGMDDLSSLPSDELVARLDEIEHAVRVLEAERARGLAEVERRRMFAVDGHLSSAAWLAHRHGVSRRFAEASVRRALALEQMPAVARAFAGGEVSASAVAVLASAQEAAPDAFGRSESELLDAARTMGFAELRATTDAWRVAADREQALEEEDLRHERRRLDLCPDVSGMTRVSGEVDAEDGQVLITAIRAQMDAETRSRTGSDARTPTQRRADALGEICRAWLASRDRPMLAGERPHVVITIDLDALDGRSGGEASPAHARLEDTGSITPETARRLACDADVTRVVTRGGSQPLELGRRTKVVPPGLRRAISVRDGGCRFPGCGRPPGWCDAHHVRHWADGGETSLSNLVLLCRPHHRTIHRGFGVQMVDGRPVFTRPDGSLIEDRAPPPT